MTNRHTSQGKLYKYLQGRLFPRWSEGGSLPVRVDRTAEGVYYIVTDAVSDDWSKGAVLFCHGNNLLLKQCAMQKKLERLHEAFGMPVCSWEFTGYGYAWTQEGPTEASLKADVLSVYKMMCSRCPPEKVVVVGFSLGGLPALQLAAEPDVKVRGLLLSSTFSSVLSAGGLTWLYGKDSTLNIGRNDELIQAVRCPVLIEHGLWDCVIPAREARRLHRAATQAGVKCVGAHIHVFGCHQLFLQRAALLWGATVGSAKDAHGM